MKVLSILPLRDSINLKIFAAFAIHKYFEIRGQVVSFVVVSDNPLLASTVNLITGSTVITLPKSEIDKSFDKALNFANRGSEGIVFITPGNNLKGWIEFLLKRDLAPVGVIPNEPASSIEELCLEQLVTSDVFSGFINLNKRLSDLGDFVQIDHFDPLIPEYSFAEYHVPKIDYSLTRSISESVQNQIEKCSRVFSLSHLNTPGSIESYKFSQSLTVYFSEDAFFNYSFKENMSVLTSVGVTVKTFSPALMKKLPDDADLIWITGANIFEAHLALGKETNFYDELVRYISIKKPAIIEGLSAGLLSSEIFVANKKLAINRASETSLTFKFAPGELVELEPHSTSPFFQSPVYGWRIPHYTGDLVTQGFYRSSTVDNFFLDLCFPRANVLVTQTYIPLLFNPNFMRNLLQWAASFK